MQTWSLEKHVIPEAESVLLSPEVTLTNTKCVSLRLSSSDPDEGVPVSIIELLTPSGEQLLWLTHVSSRSWYVSPRFSLGPGRRRFVVRIKAKQGHEITLSSVDVSNTSCESLGITINLSLLLQCIELSWLLICFDKKKFTKS